MTETELADLFTKWWTESYPTPPGPHARMTHIGWATFLMRYLASMERSPMATPEVER